MTAEKDIYKVHFKRETNEIISSMTEILDSSTEDTIIHEDDLNICEIEKISVTENPYYDIYSKPLDNKTKINRNVVEEDIDKCNWEPITLIKNEYYDSDDEIIDKFADLRMVEKYDNNQKENINDWEAVTKIDNPYYDSDREDMDCELNSNENEDKVKRIQ